MPVVNQISSFEDLKLQVENLFSIEELAQNMYLLSGMDDEGYIPIESVLYHFSQKLIFVSTGDVIESVRNSDKVVVDEAQSKIRPNIDVERKTIILRDIADSTEDEVRSIFDGIAPVESVKPPVENNWFVVLDSEASALHALHAIQNKPFKNSVIHARIKNESRAVLINKMVSSLLDSFSSYNAFNPNSSSVFSSATMPYTASGDSDHLPPRGSKYPRFLEFHI